MEKRYDMICDSCGKLHCADDGTLRRDEYGSPLCSTCEDWILTAIEEPVVLATAYDSLTAEVEKLRETLGLSLDREAAIEQELDAAHERIKMLERDLTIARECIEMFMARDPSDSFSVKAEDESDEYHTGTEAIERIDAALAGGKE